MEDDIEIPFGVSLLTACTWLGCIVMSLFAIIILIATISDQSGGLIMGISAFVIMITLAYLFGKLAGMTGRMEPKAWWWQMALSVIGLFQINPISLIILIYLWINRRLFGIVSKSTEQA